MFYDNFSYNGLLGIIGGDLMEETLAKRVLQGLVVAYVMLCLMLIVGSFVFG